MRHKLYLVEIALLLGLACLFASGAAALGQQDRLADQVVRLHVLANSDSEADQTLKLQVRDAILDRAEDILENARDRTQAEEDLQAALPELEALAAAEIAARGYGYGVTARLEPAEFPTRVYDGFTLPAGEYLALRIVIGAGEGQNWWCVVFPPLCAAAASDVPAAALAGGLEEGDIRLITGENEGYVLKCKAVELWETLRQKCNR